MGGRLSANNITFESATSNSFMHSFIDKATYNVYCNGETIGLVIFIPGRIKLVVGELSSEYRISDIAIEMQSIDRVLDATKPKIVEMYHESRGDLFEDALEFKHRDPANIGNGLHDYDVLYDGNAIGKLLFPNYRSYDNSQSECVVFRPVKTTASFYTEMAADQFENFSSNREILNSLRPNIISIMIDNKIAYK